MQAAQDAGVRYLASDASHPTQAAEQVVPGFNLMLLPRYPTAVFYNATTPAENTDEYNYLFNGGSSRPGRIPARSPGRSARRGRTSRSSRRRPTRRCGTC